MENEVEFDQVFSLRKPRDVKAGLASGAKSAAKGILAGAFGLIAAPAVGAHQEGLKGFAKGAVAGVAGAVLLPVTGVAVGATQVVRGIANTPEAVREEARGRRWDSEQRRWVSWNGTEVMVADPTAAPLRLARTDGGADYYALLGIESNASQEEIKRAYYLAARKMHPDKNPNDPEAHAKFQALAEAYQVLGNEELRRRYDAHGAAGLDVNFIDGWEFFTALFGSDRFEHLVGELMIAAAARMGSAVTADSMRRIQSAREASLAELLKERLRVWVEGDEAGFINAAGKEARELANASYGERMVHAIGEAYRVSAKVSLGGLIEGSLTSIRAQGRVLRGQLHAAGLAVRAYQAQQQIAGLEAEAEKAQKAAEEGRNEGAAVADQEALAAIALAAHSQRVAAEEASLPLMLDAMWAANALDIDVTVRRVCRSVLNDPSVSKAHRRRRAEGLIALSREFLGVRAPESSASVSAKDQMEAAMAAVAEKRMHAP